MGLVWFGGYWMDGMQGGTSQKLGMENTSWNLREGMERMGEMAISGAGEFLILRSGNMRLAPTQHTSSRSISMVQ